MTSVTNQIESLSKKTNNSRVPKELSEKILLRLGQLESLVNSPTFLPEFDRINRYVDWVLSIPWGVATKDVLDIDYSKKVLDKYHFGLDSIKNRILEYVSVMKLKQQNDSQASYRAPILCFVGLVGTGKTTIAKSIAEAMGRKFVRIPFGGMGDPLDLRGQSRMHSEAEPGKVIKSLKTAGSMNPVILLDEIDRVTDKGRASIMGVLVELLDPEQNHEFIDHYIDHPVDLSKALFIATANNTTNIATAVLDRLEPIKMPSYTDLEKITIAKSYMLPKILAKSGISEEVLTIDDDVWALVTRPLGFDAGIRTLERTIEGIARKVARMKIEGKLETLVLTKENVKEFLPD